MKIDTLTENDLPELSELFRQFWGEASLLENMRMTFWRIATNPSYRLLAARQENRLIGFAMGVICEELYGDGRPFMVVEDLIVDKQQRRTGAGSELMRTLEKWAVDHDCCQVIFVTEAERTTAQRFYQSLGYESKPYKGFKKRL
jgi:GNAT superfamily N-acetyltransferase